MYKQPTVQVMGSNPGATVWIFYALPYSKWKVEQKMAKKKYVCLQE
jgi:hypothetical protein